jgi:hypothetical protein
MTLPTFKSKANTSWNLGLNISAVFFFLTLGVAVGLPSPIEAASGQTAPSQLKTALTRIDEAANRRQINELMQFYSPKFANSDGLNRQDIQKSLTQLWQRYPQLTYRTELQSWQKQSQGTVAETVTYISGIQQLNGREFKLNATVRSRQYFQGNKIIKQEILSERTVLTSGVKPPTVEVKIPERIGVGQQYNFDAIVKEPLEDDVLLGAAIEEPVRSSAYLQPSVYDLDALPAGGLFKVGKAPNKAGNYWVSAIVIRADGMTMVTRRLQVVGHRRPSGLSNK